MRRAEEKGNVKTIKKLLAVATITIACGTSAFAASDGTVGTTSTGSSDLSITIPELIQISNVADLALNPYTGTGNFSQSDAVCVYSNMTPGASADYHVTVTGGNPPGTQGAGFFVGNATTDDSIPFQVYWNDATNATGEVELTHATVENASDFDVWDQDLSNGCTNNAQFRVFMTEANILLVNAGTYTNSISILLTPSPS